MMKRLISALVVVALLLSWAPVEASTWNQFFSGIKSIQHGTIAISGTSTNTATITAVNTAKAVLIFDGFKTGSTSLDQGASNVFLTNSTTVTATKGTGTNDSTASFTVVEYY